jgi:DNA-binding response OmpR family regulator
MSTILVIEDEKLARFMLCNMLQKKGFEVLEAADGLEGMDHVENKNIALVVTDLIMPNFDGINFLSLLVSLHPEIELIAWSGLSKDDPTYIEATKIIGEDRVVPKSGNLDELVNKIKAILK